MTEKNREIDVFKSIDMSGGPNVCWPWKGKLAANGRPYFTVDGKKWIAYKLVQKLITGTAPQADKLERHTCDNGACCNYAHLITGTHQENMNDMKERERHGLPHHVVKSIRRLLTAKRTQEEIAILYGISRETVSAIATGRVYKHIKQEDENK